MNGREREREKKRQKDRKSERLKERKTGRQRDRETERQKDRYRENTHINKQKLRNKPGLTSLSILLSLMAASSWTPMAKKSAALAGYSP